MGVFWGSLAAVLSGITLRVHDVCVCFLFMAFCLGFITTPDYKKRVMGGKKFCLNLNSDFFFRIVVQQISTEP